MDVPRFLKYLGGLLIATGFALLAIMIDRGISAGGINYPLYGLLTVAGGGILALGILALVVSRRRT